MSYQAVGRGTAGGLRAVALVGSHTAVLGFDLPEDPATHAGLLGFAVQRAVVATEFLRVLDHYRFRNRIAAIAERYDANEPAPAPMLAGDADGDVWIIAPEDVPLEPPTGDAPAVLGAVAANVWLREDDTWQAPYYTPSDARCRARTVFAPPTSS